MKMKWNEIISLIYMFRQLTENVKCLATFLFSNVIAVEGKLRVKYNKAIKIRINYKNDSLVLI